MIALLSLTEPSEVSGVLLKVALCRFVVSIQSLLAFPRRSSNASRNCTSSGCW